MSAYTRPPSRSTPSTTPTADDPYCGQCGYNLRGATESPACPECGGALVDVLRRRSDPRIRRVRRQSSATIFGYPVCSIAFGPDLAHGEKRGHAKGLIAIGDVATGGIAIGGVSLGVVSIGGCAYGVASIGGAAVGLATALGGGAVGVFAVGGAAAGFAATGGGAVGYYAQGGAAYGVYARGGMARGTHTISNQAGTADPAAVAAFDSISLVMGTSAAGKSWINTPAMWSGATTIGLSVLIGMVALFALARGRSSGNDQALRFGPSPGARLSRR